MDITQRTELMQRWHVVQQELLPELMEADGPLTPRLINLIHILEWVRIEEFVEASWCGIGRPPHERSVIANAFVAKVVLKLDTTTGLIDRLQVDRALRRICGFPRWKKIPSESTFSRAFDEFAQAKLAERVQEALVKEHLGDELIGHISRDGTAIEVREKPVRKEKQKAEETPATEQTHAAAETPAMKETPTASETLATEADLKPGRKGESTKPKLKRITQQLNQALDEMLAELPKDCDRGSKSNAQGYKNSWNGYKLHIDTADCGVPVSAILTSASLHDSQVSIPLATMTAARVTNCYDLMDAAYCSEEIRSHSRSLDHVPLIDHNPRGGEKIEFAPAQAERYKERSQAERTNARLKDEFGGNAIWVRGHSKVASHLMFGLLVLTADQLMRLLT